MDALISGSAKMAALVSGDSALVINYEGKSLRSTNYNDVARQFFSYDDIISLKSTNEKKALQLLRLESDRSDALLLVLSILDSQVPDETKPELARYANSFLENDSILSYILGVLYARPLPSPVIEVIPDAITKKFNRVSQVIMGLQSSQAIIMKIYNYWMGVAHKFKLIPNDVRYVEGVFASLGISYALSQDSIKNAVYSELKFECLQKLNSLPSGRQIVTSLFSEFKNVDSRTSKNFYPKAFEAYDEKSTRQARPVNIHEIYENVKAQLGKVSELLKKGDTPRAKTYANELVNAQIERNENSYAAMSLCHLSEEAKKIGDFSLQLEWANRAVDVEPLDSRTYGHVADAYLNLCQLENARRWFDKCVEQGDKIFGRTGLARIERTLFNYDKALELVETICLENPNEGFVLNLKAELLKDLGRLDESASLYEELKDKFPETSISICGLASVRTDQKYFKQAESTYRDAIRLYPNDQVPLTGLGFLLARQGRFKEAFSFLDKGVALSKGIDFIPRMAKASALRMKGMLSDAEGVYRSLIASLPFYIDSRLELIETLVDGGKYEEAEAVINDSRKSFKNDFRLDHSKALLLMHQSELVEALSLLDLIKINCPRWIHSLLTRAKVLKQLRSFDAARKQYNDILNLRPLEWRARIGIEMVDAIAASYLNIDHSIKSEIIVQDVLPNSIEEWEELNIKGLLLLTQNRTEEARKILLKGFNKNPFKPIKNNVAISLSIARLMLGQYSTAINSIKNAGDDLGKIQKAIVYGEQNKLVKANANLAKVIPQGNLSNVMSLVTNRYSQTMNQADKPSANEVINEQLRTLLLVA